MWMEAIVTMLFFLGMIYGVTWIMGRIAFSPLYERTLLFQPSARFRISDLMVLALHVQILLALAVASMGSQLPADRASQSEMAFLCAHLCAMVTFWWLNGLRMLGRGGVNNTWHRWTFLGLLLPIGYGCGILIVVSIFSVPYLLFESFQSQNAVTIVAMLVLCASWPGMYIVNRLTRKFVLRARQDRAEEDGIHFSNETVFAPTPIPRRQHRPYR